MTLKGEGVKAMTLFLVWTLNHHCTHLKELVGSTKDKHEVRSWDGRYPFFYEYPTSFRLLEVSRRMSKCSIFEN